MADAGECLAIGQSLRGNSRIDMYGTDGVKTGSWSNIGAGPGELLTVDGLTARPDTVIVWDRSNGRLTWLDCRGTVYGSRAGLMPGLQVAAAGDGAVAFSHDAFLGGYGVWLSKDGTVDTIGPRIGARIRAAPDLIVAGPDGNVVVLDASVGAVAWYHPGAATPHRVDTIPVDVASPFREAFRTKWVTTPELATLDPSPMQVAWLSFLDGESIMLGTGGLAPLGSIAAVRLNLRERSAVRIGAPSDPGIRSGLLVGAAMAQRGDTLFSVSVDSFYRFVLKPQR